MGELLSESTALIRQGAVSETGPSLFSLCASFESGCGLFAAQPGINERRGFEGTGEREKREGRTENLIRRGWGRENVGVGTRLHVCTE